MRISMRRLIVTGVAGTFAVTLVAAPAMATDPPVQRTDGATAAVSGDLFTIGSFTIDNFTNVKLDGTQKTTTAALSTFTVTDPRGTGAGWHVNVKASTPTAATGGFTLANNTMTLTSLPTPEKVDQTSGDVPTVSPSSDAAIDTGSGSAVKYLSAAADSNGTGARQGMGSFNSGAAVATITLPASAYVGTYTTTVTTDLVTAP